MELAGFIGYIIASVAFLGMVLLLFAARNTTLAGRLMLLSSIFFFAALSMAAIQIQHLFSIIYVFPLESLKLLLFSVLIIATKEHIFSVKALFASKQVAKFFLAWCFASLGCVLLLKLDAESYSSFIFLFFLTFNLWLIVLIEQLFRNASSKEKWALWPLVLALGATSVFDFVLFAQAYMLSQLEYTLWFIRAYVAIISMPFLLVSTRRMKDWSVRVFVSRHVVFYSSMLLMAGGYLLVMAFAGYVINYIGGQWGQFISISFVALSLVVLVALLITDTLRRKVKVFIAKNFFANKYEYRDEWLDLIEKIETTSAESYYHMATNIMMSKLQAANGCLLKKLNNHKFQVRYTDGVDISDSLQQQLIVLSKFSHKKGWIIDLKEYKHNPTVYEDLDVDVSLFEKLHIEFLIPIFIGKFFYGFFVIGHCKEYKGLNWEDRDLLFAISKQLANFISLHEANERIAESKQFDAFNRMSAFLVHDLKNVQAQLALINDNAVKHRDNPAFVDDVFETVESATNRLDKMLTQLRNKQAEQSRAKKIDIVPVLDKVVQQCNIRQPAVSLKAIDSCIISVDDESFYSVMNHLIQNAQEATNNSGWVKVDVSSTDTDVVINIQDNGSGMSEDFIKTRLFKPFDTTKGNAGMGIGVFEAKQFFEGNAGSLSVESEEDQGTTFTLSLPINPSYEG